MENAYDVMILGGPKALRREIDRRLEYVSHIKHEPPLIDDGPAQSRTSYRIAAVEEIRFVTKNLVIFTLRIHETRLLQ